MIMERAQNINPQRIIWSCEEFGITPDILSNQLKISSENFKKTLNGEDGITVNQLRRIAQYFERGLLFFLEEEPINEETIHSPQFRTLNSQKPFLSPELKVLIERIEKQRDIYINLLDDLGIDEEFDWNRFRLPSNSIQDIKRSASRIRGWLGLSERETFASYRTKVEIKGVFVFVTNGYKGQWQIAKDDPIRGFSLFYPKYPVIAIKKQQSERPQVFTLMHELGHLLLHREGFIDDEHDFFSNQGKEKTANEFAGNVLVPDEYLAQIDLDNFPYDEISKCDNYLQEYCQQWSVSAEVILRRLLNEGILDDRYYEEYRTWEKELPPSSLKGGSRTTRFKEPVRMFGVRFVDTVLNAYHENRITLAKASTYLDNLKITDIHKLEKMHGSL